MLPPGNGPLIDRIVRHAAAARAGVPFGLQSGYESGFSVPVIGADGEMLELQAAVDSTHEVVRKMTGANLHDPPTIDRCWSVILLALEQDAAQNIDLVQQVIALRDEITARLADQSEARKSEAEAELEALLPRCREALDQVNSLTNQQSSAQMTLNNLGEPYAAARSSLRAVEGQKPHPSTYPTREEMQRWVDSVNAARVTAVEMERRWKAAEQQAALIDSRLERAKVKLAELQQQEKRLRDRIAGAPVTTLRGPSIDEFDRRGQPQIGPTAILRPGGQR